MQWRDPGGQSYADPAGRTDKVSFAQGYAVLSAGGAAAAHFSPFAGCQSVFCCRRGYFFSLDVFSDAGALLAWLCCTGSRVGVALPSAGKPQLEVGLPVPGVYGLLAAAAGACAVQKHYSLAADPSRRKNSSDIKIAPVH